MTEADWPFVLLVDPELTHQTHFNVIRCPYRKLYPVGERANRVMLMPAGGVELFSFERSRRPFQGRAAGRLHEPCADRHDDDNPLR